MTHAVMLPERLATALPGLQEEIGVLEEAEGRAVRGTLASLVRALPGWAAFEQEVQEAWRSKSWVVIRGLPGADPRGFLAVLTALGQRFRTYRGAQVVKKFTMSPWTTELSHTLAEGHFHTDLNTLPVPPRVTAIQCVTPDPSAPQAGILRVVTLTTLVDSLVRQGEARAASFLLEADVCMVSESEPGNYQGRMVEGDEVRFHPETLRAAQRRLGAGPRDLEDVLTCVHQVAIQASCPVHLDVGDVLAVSNRRVLHYRGPCTVRFRNFPRDFESRAVHVVHLMDECA